MSNRQAKQIRKLRGNGRQGTPSENHDHDSQPWDEQARDFDIRVIEYYLPKEDNSG